VQEEKRSSGRPAQGSMKKTRLFTTARRRKKWTQSKRIMERSRPKKKGWRSTHPERFACNGVGDRTNAPRGDKFRQTRPAGHTTFKERRDLETRARSVLCFSRKRSTRGAQGSPQNHHQQRTPLREGINSAQFGNYPGSLGTTRVFVPKPPGEGGAATKAAQRAKKSPGIFDARASKLVYDLRPTGESAAVAITGGGNTKLDRKTEAYLKPGNDQQQAEVGCYATGWTLKTAPVF